MTAQQAHRAEASADQVFPYSEPRCQRLALEALEMHLRDQRRAEPSGLRNAKGIIGVRLHALDAKEGAKLAGLVNVNRVAKRSQTPRKAHCAPGLEPDPGRFSPFQEYNFPVDAFYVCRASCLMNGRPKFIDDANARRLNTDVEARPKLLGHWQHPLGGKL